MPIAFKCPTCGHKLTAADNAVGKRVKCPQCGEPLTVRETSEPASRPKDGDEADTLERLERQIGLLTEMIEEMRHDGLRVRVRVGAMDIACGLWLFVLTTVPILIVILALHMILGRL